MFVRGFSLVGVSRRAVEWLITVDRGGGSVGGLSMVGGGGSDVRGLSMIGGGRSGVRGLSMVGWASRLIGGLNIGWRTVSGLSIVSIGGSSVGRLGSSVGGLGIVSVSRSGIGLLTIGLVQSMDGMSRNATNIALVSRFSVVGRFSMVGRLSVVGRLSMVGLSSEESEGSNLMLGSFLVCGLDMVNCGLMSSNSMNSLVPDHSAVNSVHIKSSVVSLGCSISLNSYILLLLFNSFFGELLTTFSGKKFFPGREGVGGDSSARQNGGD